MEILIVDDDAGHCELVRRNLRRSGISNDIRVFHSGQEALDHLSGGDPQGPVLVLLDINMPGMDGVEVLRRLKSDPERRKVPVIMLTTTDDPREVERCYGLGCNIYITKPVEPSSFIEAIQRLGLFITVVRIPGAA